ncbi:MAG: Na+/H+ antiporter NhaA [Bacteroidetes bacterium]|nr:Na+/H+ antiporter NhaA [Bacteroidota bacterium]
MKNIRHHILTPLRFFFNDSRSTGVLLIGCTIISIFLVNSSHNGSWYSELWTSPLPWSGRLNLPESLLEWINNFMMAFFFVLAATEIKRELISGELASFKKAILPIGAAFGGMLVPALIFAIFSFRTIYAHGWGIPTATDIAFSLAAASLLGKRFPVGLKILLMALAIIDDLGAIVVIAFFYGGKIQWMYLGLSGLVYTALLLCNYYKIKFSMLQVVLGFCLWYMMLQSGIEASISGVLFAFAMPVNSLAVIEKAIHKIVNLGILPLFALANTAILFPSSFGSALHSPVGMGIICGLVIGKPVGIFLISRIMVAFKIAQLPANVNWKQFFGMGTLAGIGFTMSIFTTMLAFSEHAIRDIAKISILTSVVASVVLSYLYFTIISKKKAIVSLPKSMPQPNIALNLSKAQA